MSSAREEKRSHPRAGEASQVLVSLEERRRLKMSALAKRGDELRAQRVREIREQLEHGTYHTAAADVAAAMLRGEVTRLLSDKHPDHKIRR